MKGAADRNPIKRSNGEESTYERVGDVSFGIEASSVAARKKLLIRERAVGCSAVGDEICL